MKLLFTLLSTLFLQLGFSQIESPSAQQNLPNSSSQTSVVDTKTNFLIIIDCLPEVTEEFTELNFYFDNKGTYSFQLSPDILVKENYTVVLKDVRSGNTFNLQSKEPHHLSVNRPMTKQFTLQLRTPVSLTNN